MRFIAIRRGGARHLPRSVEGNALAGRAAQRAKVGHRKLVANADPDASARPKVLTNAERIADVFIEPSLLRRVVSPS